MIFIVLFTDKDRWRIVEIWSCLHHFREGNVLKVRTVSLKSGYFNIYSNLIEANNYSADVGIWVELLLDESQQGAF